MAYRFTSFTCVLLLSLSLVANGKRLNRASVEQEPTQSTLQQDTAAQPGELDGSGGGVSAEEAPKTLQSSQCAAAIRDKQFQVIERMQAYLGPPCNVAPAMLEPELSEEGKQAICAPQCFTSDALETPLSGIQEILENCGGDPNFPMFESTYLMVKVMDDARDACSPVDMDDVEPLVTPEPVQIQERTMIVQMKLQIGFKNCFSSAAKSECGLVKEIFRQFDLRGMGDTTIDEYNRVLYLLSESAKKEAIDMLKGYLTNLGKAEDEPITLEELLKVKMTWTDARDCLIAYVTHT